MANPNLRQLVVNQIYAALEKSDFSLRDFEVDVTTSNSLARIVFLPKPQYEFVIAEKNYAVSTGVDPFRRPPPEFLLTTIESPGDYKVRDSEWHGSIDQCISRITKWCKNIKEDLAARPIVQEDLSDWEIEIERRISETAGDSQERFSDSEANVLSQKLDGLVSKFEELERARTITEKEVAEVRAELQKMKGTLSLYPKSTWYKTAGHKLLDVTKRVLKTKEGRDFLLASAKKLLGLDP